MRIARSKQVQIDFLLSNTLTPRLVFFQKSRSLKTSTIKQLSVLNCQHCVGILSKNNKIVIINPHSLQLQMLKKKKSQGFLYEHKMYVTFIKNGNLKLQLLVSFMSLSLLLLLLADFKIASCTAFL